MNKFYLGREKFTSIRKTEFEYLLSAVAFYAAEARSEYTRLAGQRIPFVSVGHDVWDSVAKEVLGVIVFFYNPKRELFILVPIGLVRITDKKAGPTVLQTLEVLKWAGVFKLDLYKCVSDNANGSKAVGRQLVGEDGTCAMHWTQLIMEHATGKRTRTKNRVTIDSFPECEATRKKAKDSANHLMNKKSKGRLKKYFDEMKSCGRKAVKIMMPNDTRAAGLQKFYRSLLVSR